MKKRLIVYGILFLLVGAFLYFRCLVGVTYLNYCRIYVGDSAEDVEALLRFGGPGERNGQPIRYPNQGSVQYWHGYDGRILVFYDVDNRVIGTEWVGTEWNHILQERWACYEAIWERIKRELTP